MRDGKESERLLDVGLRRARLSERSGAPPNAGLVVLASIPSSARLDGAQNNSRI